MDGIKLPFLIEVWNGEFEYVDGTTAPGNVQYRFNLDCPSKVKAFFDRFLKNSLDLALSKHHFTDLDDYVKSETGSSLEDLELLADERLWKLSRFCSGRNYSDFMKNLRVGFESQLPSKTLEVQTDFVNSLMKELVSNETGHYPYFQKLIYGGSPFGNLGYGDGGYFDIHEFDDWAFE